MSCYRYNPKTREWTPIKATQLTKPDRGENLTFSEQLMRGYRRQEARGNMRTAWRPSRVKKILGAA